VLLEQIGLTFDVVPSHVDETINASVPPVRHVRTLAERKAREVASRLNEGIVLSADTIVVIDGDVLNKPTDSEDAIAMLQRLSGARHEVFTGFCLLDAKTKRIESDYVRTEVWFRVLTDDEIRSYVAGGSPMDKAGSYGIQDDFGAVFVEKIYGDFYNVVGLPLARVYAALQTFQNGTA
jgi:septum formation protein